MPHQPLLLTGLSHEEQAELVAAAQPRLLTPREVLGHQGEPADRFALVQIGYLKLGQVNPAGAESLVRFIGPVDCYGAVAIVPGKRFPVSAIAVEPSRVLIWVRPVITRFADRLPRLKSNIFDEVTRRMAGVLSAAQDLATERVPQRLARALLRVATHGGSPTTGGGLKIVHPLTRQELADLTGATLFTVSRLMSSWETAGLLHTGRRTVTILDPEGLELAASSGEDA
ncbi:MAG: Crp/Fnr family transcriptional regulator [Vicinamibacterales bacterium]